MPLNEPLSEPPTPCREFRPGEFSGFTEHILATGCKKCVELFLYLVRVDLMTRYGKTHRN
jgi:hypothetical protein